MFGFNSSRLRMRPEILRLAASTVAAALILLAAACGGGGGDETSTPSVTANPGIVLVSSEGLGVNALASYGAPSSKVPILDELAAQNVRFQWCFAQSPLAGASFASLMTGLYPTTHGFTRAGEKLAPAAPTLAEQLQKAGFATAHFNDGGPGDTELGLTRGFAVVSGEGTPGAAAWLAKNTGQRFFLNLHLEGEGVENRMDSALGALRKVLEDAKRTGEVVFVVASIHGVAVVEDAGAMALSVVRVPLVLELPGRAGGKDVTQFVELVDLMPTILDAVGVPAPEGTQGASLLPLVNGQGQPPYIAFGESSEVPESRFVALGGHRMVTTVDGDELHLFNLEQDPDEQEDIAAADSSEAAVRRMSSDLEAWSKMVASASLDPAKRSEELDEATLEQLKSLGYIQ